MKKQIYITPNELGLKSGQYIVAYDVEVFACDWIVVITNIYNTDEKIIIHNNPQQLINVFNNPNVIFVGFNNKNYDKQIVKAIYYGANNEEVHSLSKYIINGGNGWEHETLLLKRNIEVVDIDLRDDLAKGISLKQVEAKFGMNIKECSVDFELNRELNEDEISEVIKYCIHDVMATVKLFHARKEYVMAKVGVAKFTNINVFDALSFTNAKLTAKALRASKGNRVLTGEYMLPRNLYMGKYEGLKEQFLEGVERYFTTYNEEDTQNNFKITTKIAGVEHNLGLGGLHGAERHCNIETNELYSILSADVISYYPSIMINYGLISRNIPSIDLFRQIYDFRINAKKKGDLESANAFKLLLNTTFGATKNKYNLLYDPDIAIGICLTGQLLLIDLIDKLENLKQFRLIQSNTDGIMFSVLNKDIEIAKDIIKNWEERTNLTMDLEKISKIVQKDVNNYVLVNSNDKVKAKGAICGYYEKDDLKNMRPICCQKAFVQYLLNGIPILDTLKNCNMNDFVFFAKAGKSYEGVFWEVNHKWQIANYFNRCYATIDKTYGSLAKKKYGKIGFEKIANMPQHLVIDNENILTNDYLVNIDHGYYQRRVLEDLKLFGIFC